VIADARASAAGALIARRFHDVAHNRRTGRLRLRRRDRKTSRRPPHRRASDRVEHIVDIGQRMRLRQQRRMHAQFDLSRLRAARHRDQLDDIAQFRARIRCRARRRRECLRDKYRLDINRRAERDAGQNRQLIHRVEAIDIGGRVGFGVAQFLRFGQHVREVAAFARHFGQDVIGGAVENAHQFCACGCRPGFRAAAQ
jgi:hypothetical protein